MIAHKDTQADIDIKECLRNEISFNLVAGAGSGKTTSLIQALRFIRAEFGQKLRQNGQRVACITYTNRASEVIRSRLDFDELFAVSTLHSFLWNEIKTFQKDILETVKTVSIPRALEKAREDDNGKPTKKARKARQRVERLEAELARIDEVTKFNYSDAKYSDFLAGQLSHDDIIEISAHLLRDKAKLRMILGHRYPYIFIDEAQDTFPEVIDAFNMLGGGDGLPVTGYFGDPWQQIFEKRAGDFNPPENGREITKVENFRSAQDIVALLNAFRDDIDQVPAGENKDLSGSIELRLVQAEEPDGPRKRYTEEQIERALHQMDHAVEAWGWTKKEEVVRLFLVRQMIARRLGFPNLNSLFNGIYSSGRSQDDYDSGQHYLLKPFVDFVVPLLRALKDANEKASIDIFRQASPVFDPRGSNAKNSLKEILELAKSHASQIDTLFSSGTTKDVLSYCGQEGLYNLNSRLLEHLKRSPRDEEYDDVEHTNEKGDWLADAFFEMSCVEIESYVDFVSNNTAFSTQHGVKGEDYDDVIVVFDDIEASWNNYNFNKLFAPESLGEPTDGQKERGKNLAYVCFSRAKLNLRILLFTPNPPATRAELIDKRVFREDQIVIAGDH